MRPPRVEPVTDRARQHQRPAGAPCGRQLLAWASGMAVAALVPVNLAHAQGTQGVRFSPYVSAQETITDNFDISGTGKLADAVTRLTAGVSGRSRSGRLKGQFDYSLSGIFFAKNSDRNTQQHRLTADLDAEWFENQGFLRTTASVQQVARSAFESARADGLPGSNSTDLRTLTLAPRWQGFLGSGLRINLQGSASYSDASDSNLGSVSSGLLAAHLEPTQRAPISWALDAIAQEGGYSQTRSTRTTRGYGSAIWLIGDLDLQLTAQAGLERSNLTSLIAKDTATWGFGLQWTPSPRTRVGAQMEQRSFGKTHDVTLEYRTARTVWQLSDSRNINTGANVQDLGFQGRTFSQLFAQFAAIEPDFDKRRELVQSYLNGNVPDSLNNSFFRTAATVDDRLAFSSLWRGTRSSAALSFAVSSSRRADPNTLGLDDLDRSNRVRQRILSLTLGHRLTPVLTGSLTASYQTGKGGLAIQSSRQSGLTVQLGGQMGPKDSWSLAARHTSYEISQAPYAENALVATYDLRF